MKKLLAIAVAIALTILAGCYNAKTEKTTDSPALKQTETREKEASSATVKTQATVETKLRTETTVVKQISMESANFFFKSNTLSLKMNQPVKITFKNTGVHTFTVDELGVNVKLTDGSGSVTFTPKKTGTFQYYCAIPGHKEAGMVGTVTVTQ